MDTVQVFDTWVKASGRMLHFDVMTTDEATALKLANDYVASQGHTAVSVTARECRYCHAEPLVLFDEHQQRQFHEAGGFIVPLAG
ncbi:MAG TPA: DUF2024 family protein [Nitrospira sp.]|nr:DUF2024 family protein [Nitrospira sp.]